MNEIEMLYEKISSVSTEMFFEMENKFCAALYYGISEADRPPCVTVFLTVVNWFAVSFRSGVWTFFEAGNRKDIELTAKFLEETGEKEFADIFRYGIHDYQNPKYAENFDYPDEWIEEAEKIDEWINQHSNWLYDWERKLLLDNKDLICSCFSKE